jgi:hypothetical protein
MGPLASLSSARSDELQIAVITSGSQAEHRAKRSTGTLFAILVQDDREVELAYGINLSRAR